MSTAVRCRTCLSSHRDDIDTSLAAGRTYAQVSTAFGVSTGSLVRHKRDGHMRTGPRRAPATLPASKRPGPDASAYEHAKRLVNDLAKVDISKMSPREQSAHAETYRRSLDTLGRLQPAGAAAQTTDLEGQVATLEAILAAQDEAIDAALDLIPDHDVQTRVRRALGVGIRERLKGVAP
jgi:hypothetical protein